MSYAEKTSVNSEKSRAEIERILTRYGAESFMYGWEKKRAIIRFQMNDRRIQFTIPFPDRFDKEFTHTERGKARTKDQAEKWYEQGVRQKWRALALVIKAKLEAVESGITVFDDEFMSHIQLPNGSTVGDIMKPQIEQAYIDGKMPAMLPEFTSGG